MAYEDIYKGLNDEDRENAATGYSKVCADWGNA